MWCDDIQVQIFVSFAIRSQIRKQTFPCEKTRAIFRPLSVEINHDFKLTTPGIILFGEIVVNVLLFMAFYIWGVDNKVCGKLRRNCHIQRMKHEIRTISDTFYASLLYKAFANAIFCISIEKSS